MANDNTWFKLYRKIKEWEWYQDHITKAVFLHCLIEAEIIDKPHCGGMLEKGSFVTTSSRLAAELNLSRQQVRTALDKLVSTSNITKTSTNKNLIIKVVNWEYYQDKKGNSNHQNNQQVNQQITNKQPTNNQQKDNNIYTYKDINTLKDKDLKDKEFKNERIKELNTSSVLLEKDEKGEMTPYKEIVEYLNEKTGLNLRHTTNKTRDLIKARWNEGFRLEDFKSAIDNAVKFRTKPNGEIDTRYLMPKTIFNGSFETRVLGTTYKSKSKEMEKEEQVDILKGRYDHLITRD